MFHEAALLASNHKRRVTGMCDRVEFLGSVCQALSRVTCATSVLTVVYAQHATCTHFVLAPVATYPVVCEYWRGYMKAADLFFLAILAPVVAGLPFLGSSFCCS
jgi:hypothetical protein